MLSWLKSVGDEVTVGDELVEIETDKANMVFEADAAGILLEILAPEGETRPIGSAIARVGAAAMAQTQPHLGSGSNGRRRRHRWPAGLRGRAGWSWLPWWARGRAGAS